MEKVSIIVPVYNMQKYLERCLDSLLGQSHANIEVLCVDDGSTDESGKICDSYREKDERIKVYHIENHGVSYARNYGLLHMQGDWFSFVDADDWVESDFILTLLENAREHNSDVSVCYVQKDKQYSTGYRKDTVRVTEFNSPNECIRNYICSTNSMEGMSCNKLYKASLYKEIRFNEEMVANEDCLYTYEIMSRCHKACLTSASLYHWFYREDSISHSNNVKCDFSQANVFLDLYDKTKNMRDVEIEKTLRCNYIFAVLKVLLFADYSKKDKEVKAARNNCKEYRSAVWHTFSVKEKVKYVLAVYLKWFFCF